MTSPAPPYDTGNPFTPGGPSDMVTAILPAVEGKSQQMAVTIRVPGTTLTVLLDKRTGEQWVANIAQAAALLAEPAGQPASANGHGHSRG